MTNSTKAYDYGTVLNIIPVGLDGYAIELSPVNNGEEVRWRWSVSLGIRIIKWISEESFNTREDAFTDASEWWEKAPKYNWGHQPFCKDRKSSNMVKSLE